MTTIAMTLMTMITMAVCRPAGSLQAGAGGFQGGGGDEALPHPLSHRGRAGRHQCRAQQHGARRLEVSIGFFFYVFLRGVHSTYMKTKARALLVLVNLT
jgi:hypothetical protein